MKKSLLFSLCFVLTFIFSFSQNEKFTSIIPKSDYTKFYVVNMNNDTTVLVRENGERILLLDTQYKLVNGVGRKKDKSGIKEKYKKYLINSKGDTLSTISSNTNIQISKSTIVTRQKTKTGWKYFNSDGKVLCDIGLLWNDSSWNYSIEFYESGAHIETLKKIVMLSLIKMAHYRSKCHCPSSDCDDYLIYMFL